MARLHSDREIAEKLLRASDLQRQGQRQKEICELLGISVMTLHRWRKRRARRGDQHEQNPHAQSPRFQRPHSQSSLAELRRENLWLRTIVTDLALQLREAEEQFAAALDKPSPLKVRGLIAAE